MGAAVELSVEEAEEALDEMLQEIVDAMNELNEEEAKLFREIATAAGEATVLDLRSNFERSTDLITDI